MSKPAPNASFGLDDTSLAHTREVFQPHSAAPLTQEDCREIRQNLVGAFGVLLRIKRRLLEESRAASEAGVGAGAPFPPPEVPCA